MFCACLDLSGSSSSWCLGRAAVSDCGTPGLFSYLFSTTTKLLTVTEEIILFHGKIEVNIEIGSQKFTHGVLTADTDSEGILGMDFLTNNRCNLMLSRQFMKVNGVKIQCFANSREAQPRCCRIAISEHVEIPLETEMVVEGF